MKQAGFFDVMKGAPRAFLWALLLASGMALPAQAQTCTTPDAAVGDMIYNNALDVFQGCTTRGWMSFHKAGVDPCTTTGTAGTACGDGSIYAGTLSGVRLYTTPADQSVAAYWGTNNFTSGEVSTTDGVTNTNNLYAHVMAGDGDHNPPPDPAPNGTPNAALLCYNLVAHGYSDWYLPARDELQVLATNYAAIGGFISANYWSSTEINNSNANVREFPGGASFTNGKTTTHPVRCVRR